MNTSPTMDGTGSTWRDPQRIGLWLGPALGLAVATVLAPAGLAPEGAWVLGLLVLMATWWVTEATPLAVTALLPIVAIPLIGIDVGDDARGKLACATEGLCRQALAGPLANERTLGVSDLGAHYANPIVLLYVGGFILGIAIERWGLSKRLAFAVCARAGADPRLIVAGFLASGAFLSMWISNTSTALILMPLAMSVAAGAAAGGKEDPKFAAALALSVAYAATIGGLATPIGTPTNGIALQFLRAEGIDVTFGQWVLVGLPVTLALLPAAWFLLARDLHVEKAAAARAQALVREQLARLGRLSVSERRVAMVFAFMAGAWMFSSLIGDQLGRLMGLKGGLANLDTVIAIVGALALFVTPAGRGQRRALMTWDEAERLPWGVLLLFGGGIALASAAELSGLAAWLAQGLSGLGALDPILVILGVGLLVIVITEFASNIATISMMGPVLVSLAAATQMENVSAFIVPAALLASMGFALPVGSPPNAIAYATGKVRQADMIRRGLLMNTVAIAVITVAGLTLAPMVLR